MNLTRQISQETASARMGEIMDDYLEQLGRGQSPDVEEYAERYPELADVIRKLPALGMIQMSSGLGATGESPSSGEIRPQGPLGDFRIVREIGRGGMGVVYEAEQISLGRRVALKVLPFAAVMDQRQLARFKTEAQAAAHLIHQNIVPVHAIGCERGVHFYAMQYVDGQTLGEVIAQLRTASGLDSPDAKPQSGGSSDLANQLVSGVFAPPKRPSHLEPTLAPGTAPQAPGPAPKSPASASAETPPIAALSTVHSTRSVAYFRTAARLGVQAAEALDHAHKNGVLHRDIKPANLMLDSTGNLWITDFGLARIESDRGLTMTGDIVGTLRYMSPEQALAKRVVVDHRTDIYSLGVTLYELLTLEPAFRGRDRQELLRQIAFEEARSPRKVNHVIPAELETIVLKAMAKNPGERYATARELAEDLERFIEDKPIYARRATLFERAVKWSRRHKPVVASAAAATAIVLVVVALGATLIAAKERDHRLLAQDATRAAEQAKVVETKLRRKAERLLTASYVDRAQALCEEGEIGRGMLWLAHSLRTAPDDAADLERAIRVNLSAWHPQLHSLKMLVQHERAVQGVAISADGSRILTGSGWSFAQLWDAATGEPIGNPIHHKSLSVVALSPDGSRIVTGSNDGTAQLWDAATLQPIGQPLEHRTASVNGYTIGVNSVAFNRDGSRFVTGSLGGTVWLCDTATGRPVHKPFQHTHWVRAVAITTAGTRAVITIGLGTHQLWDIDRGEPVGPPVENVPDTAVAAISPDGLRFATSGGGSIIRVWDGATAEPALPPMTHGAEIRSLAFSPDGSRIVSGGNERAARLWDATTGRPIGVPMRHRGTVSSVAFSRDARRILTGCEDGTARLWEVASQPSLGQRIEHEDPIRSVAFSHDSLRILTECDGGLQLRDAATGRAVGKPFPYEQSKSAARMALSRDGSRVVISRSGYTRLWDVATGELIGQLGEERQGLHDVAFSPDGSRILTGSGGGFAQLWDAATVKPIGQPLEHQDAVSDVAFSPDGSLLLTGSYDATTRLWDAVTLESIGRTMVHQSELKSLAYSPDGTRIATGFADWTVRLWDAQTLEPVGIPLHHQNIVCGVAFSPDGSRLLTASLDQTARLWDVATLKPIGPPLRHESYWPRVSFSPDGSQLLVAGKYDGTGRLWQSPPGPLEGDRERILLWAQVITGLELDPSGGIGVLDGAAWQKLHRRLQELGGQLTRNPVSR